jgi:hypothetical protein
MGEPTTGVPKEIAGFPFRGERTTIRPGGIGDRSFSQETCYGFFRNKEDGWDYWSGSNRCVFTVPATSTMRTVRLQEAVRSRPECARIINEPTAAALAYGKTRSTGT